MCKTNSRKKRETKRGGPRAAVQPAIIISSRCNSLPNVYVSFICIPLYLCVSVYRYACPRGSRKKNKLKISCKETESGASASQTVAGHSFFSHQTAIVGAAWGLAFNLMPITCMSRINQPTHAHTHTHTAAVSTLTQMLSPGELPKKEQREQQKNRRQPESMQRKIRREK